jgi:hypothetical protein
MDLNQQLESLVLTGRKQKETYKISKHPIGSEEYMIDKREYMRKYRLEHKEKIKEYNETYTDKKSDDEIKAMNKLYNKRRLLKNKIKKLQLQNV